MTPGSKASRVNLCPGDIILAIQGVSTDGVTHAEAQNKIKDSTNQLFLKIERYHELFSLKDSVTNSVRRLSTTLYHFLSPPFKVTENYKQESQKNLSLPLAMKVSISTHRALFMTTMNVSFLGD